MTVDSEELRRIGKDCFGRAARGAANLVSRGYNGLLKPAELEVTQFWILLALDARKTRSITELADFLGAETSTVKRGLDRLAETGLIRAESGPGRRIRHILTKEGARRLRAALPLWRAAQETLEKRLAPARVERLRRDLDRLADIARLMVGADA